MTTYKQLQREFDKKVEQLQAACKHERKTEWMEEQWAIAHPTGFQVRQCKLCNAMVGRRTCCRKCGELLEEKDFVKGEHENKPLGRPFGDVFCQDCEDAWREFTKKHPMPKGKMIKIIHENRSETEEPYEESWHRIDVYQKFMGRR